MKRIIIILVFSLFFVFVNVAQAEERIDDFTIEIKINQDSSINVTEKITYNFGEIKKHGIYRDIPYKYKARGGTFKLRFSNIDVTYNDGKPVDFSVSEQGDNKHIKIRDAKTLVSGQQQYIIKYTVNRAINYFDTHDELYWNTTGNEWSVDIKQTRTNLVLPQSILESDLRTECFAGLGGSQDKCLSTRYEYSGTSQVKGITFINDLLSDHEGMTIVVGVPRGIIAEPTIFQNLLYIIKDNWIVVWPILVFLFLFYLWRARGRDPEGRGTIIAEFEAPDKLSPAEVGVLIDEVANKRDISAELIYLANKGFLKIKKIEPVGILKSADYELIRLREPGEALVKHDQALLKAIFAGKSSIKISELKNKFYKDLDKITKEIYKSTVAKGYFLASPRQTRGKYIVAGIIILLLSWFVGPNFGVIGVGSIVLSAIIVMIFGYFMPALTKKGVLAKEKILGLKEYINVAEKDRIKFHNAPEKNPQHFEVLLPFAMVMKLEKAWARQFANIYDSSPSWYEGSGGHFSALALTNELSGFSKTTNTSLASHPSSAGSGGSGFSGGSSGGGFGGGGGGSW
ncbi:DUF2207 domain-containing protein [Candidatus Parcubacteria bacterium]|nr:DUF2207 domain-containing protein [Candidatus Parcubacteria bacterium]